MKEIGRSIRWREALDLVEELTRELDSHLMTDLLEYQFASKPSEWAVTLHAQAYINWHMDPKKAKPVDLPFPWTSGAADEQITPEERERLRAQLNARSAFRNME